MDILLIIGSNSIPSDFVKTVSELDRPIILVRSVIEAQAHLQMSDSIKVIIFPWRITHDLSGFHAADILSATNSATQILLISSEDDLPEDKLITHTIHGYIHHTINAANLEAAIRIAEKNMRIQMECLRLQTRLDSILHQYYHQNLALDLLQHPVILQDSDLKIIWMNRIGYELIAPPEQSHGRSLMKLLQFPRCSSDMPSQRALRTKQQVSATVFIPLLKLNFHVVSRPYTTVDGQRINCVIETWSPAEAALFPRNAGTKMEYTNRSESLANLTPREWNIIPLLLRGDSYFEIAKNLSLSINTIKTHIASIYKKTNCSGRIALIRLFQAYCP